MIGSSDRQRKRSRTTIDRTSKNPTSCQDNTVVILTDISSDNDESTTERKVSVPCHIEGTSFTLKILSRTPMVRALGRDSCEYSSFTIFAKVKSGNPFWETTCPQYIRIRFFDTMAENLLQYIALTDKVVVNSFVPPFPGHEIQVVAKPLEGQRCLDFPTEPLLVFKNAKNQFRFELRVCANHRVYEIKPNNPGVPNFSLDRLSDMLEVPHSESRVWNYRLCDVYSNMQIDTRYRYSTLAPLTTESEMFFYGVVTELSRNTRISKLPKVGRVAIVNVDVVDPSLTVNFKTALVPSNPAKINVMIVCPNEGDVPLLSIGDIIRVHRILIKAHQKNFEVYLDGMYEPRVSIRLWDCSLFSEFADNTEAETIKIAARPYWSSKHPDIKAVGDPDWKIEEEHALTEYDWSQLRTYAAWVYNSLANVHCFYNSYYIPLRFLREGDPRMADIVVRVLDVEDSSTPLGQAPVNDIFGNTQYSISSQTQFSTSSFVACVGQSSHQSFGNTSFRLLVVDESYTTNEDRDLWILTNFPFYTIPQLRRLKRNTWIRVRNCEYKGAHILRPPTKFLDNVQECVEYLHVDCYRSRIVRVPHFSKMTPCAHSITNN